MTLRVYKYKLWTNFEFRSVSKELAKDREKCWQRSASGCAYHIPPLLSLLPPAPRDASLAACAGVHRKRPPEAPPCRTSPPSTGPLAL